MLQPLGGCPAARLKGSHELEDAARSAGARERDLFRYITLPLVSRSLVTAYILGFARGLGEFGATIMIAGNIPGRTQTIPTAIYVAVDSGHTEMAWAWTCAIIIISFGLLLRLMIGTKWFTNETILIKASSEG